MKPERERHKPSKQVKKKKKPFQFFPKGTRVNQEAKEQNNVPLKCEVLR